MTARAAELRAQGVDVIDLGVGEPDFNTPDNIITAAKKAMDDGFTKYTPGSGLLVLREAICEKLLRDNSLSYKPDQIIVSNGAKHSLSTCCQAILNPGDQAIIFSPFWVSFPEFIRLADGEPIVIPTFADKNFTPDFEQLEKQLNPRIKLMIINSPCTHRARYRTFKLQSYWPLGHCTFLAAFHQQCLGLFPHRQILGRSS